MRIVAAAMILAAVAATTGSAWACPTHESAQTPAPGTVVQTPAPAPAPTSSEG